MTGKKIILSAVMACVLTAGSIAVPFEGVNTPFSITASAATISQIQQIQSDMTTIANHINYVSYIQRGKASNRSNVICAYQRTLNTLYNAGLTVDGIFGPACERSTRNIQSSAGITADGIAGVGTLRVIQAKANAYINANTPRAATVSFGSMNCPTSLTQGSSFNLTGTITSSGAPILSFKGEILSGNTVVMSKTSYPNAYSVSIGSSSVNYGLAFGKLSAGSYTLKYTATAGSTTKTYTQAFTVQSKKASITFNTMTVPSGINKGQSFALAGTVKTTNQPIYSITAKILNSSNSTVLSKTVYPYTYSYSIKNSALDTAMKFGSLPSGNFTLTYTVTALDGTTSTKSYPFTVKGSSAVVVTPSSSANASRLVEAAKSDIGKTAAQMGFSSNEAWCSKTTGRWLANIGINLGDTPIVNNVVERLVGYGYSSAAYVFKDTGGVFTGGNLYKLYGGSKVQMVENRNNITPQPGDIICWKWYNSSNENYDHIGIVVSYDPATKKITTLEGNAGAGIVSTRKVCYCERAFDSTVVAIVRLK